jgi:hypothetical protein
MSSLNIEVNNQNSSRSLDFDSKGRLNLGRQLASQRLTSREIIKLGLFQLLHSK